VKKEKVKKEEKEKEEEMEVLVENVCNAHIVAFYDTGYLNNKRLLFLLHMCKKVL